MREIYVFDSAAPNMIRPLADAVDVEPMLLQAVQNENFDWLDPMFACGDPELLYMTCLKHPKNAGGILMMFYESVEEAMFYVICSSNLDLVTAISHFSSMVSNARYGVDIFDNANEEDE